MQLEELACLRQLAYRLFSLIFLYPDDSRLKAINAAAKGLREERQSTDGFSFTNRWQHLLAYMTKLPEKHFLEEEYVEVFIHNPMGATCLPYESVHVDPTGQSTGWVLALLEQEYAAAGLALSPSLRDLPDHVAVELEFMAFMCGEEAYAWNRKTEKEGIQILERQSTFLSRHLTRWLPDWARQVVSADCGGIYSMAAETLWAFIIHDRDLVGILLDRMGETPEAFQTAAAKRMPVKRQ